MLIPYFVRSRFACWTLKNPKISFFFLYGAMRTSRMTWRNPFRHWSTRSVFFSWTRSKLPQKNVFHSFTPNPSFSKIYMFDLKLISGGPKSPNFDLAVGMGWNQCHCKDYQILIPMTIHGLKSELKRSRYHENWHDALIDAPQTSESYNFWFDSWIFKFHTFLETKNHDLSKRVKISPTRGGLRPTAIERPPSALQWLLPQFLCSGL